MTPEEIELLANKYLMERYGAITGNKNVKDAFIDGIKIVLKQYAVSNSLDLDSMEKRLDEALGKETTESLNEWLKSKRQ